MLKCQINIWLRFDFSKMWKRRREAERQGKVNKLFVALIVSKESFLVWFHVTAEACVTEGF